MVMLVDAHCHLPEVRNYKIKDVIPVSTGYSHSSNRKTVELAKKLGIPFSLGIAPQSVIRIKDLSELDTWIEYIKEQKPNAIGEVGLDYHWAKEKHEIEREEITFYRMIELAEEMKLPLVIHSRKASGDVIDSLKMKNFPNRIMFHFFSGSLSEAKWIAGQGGLISVTPLHSKDRRTAIKEIPLENLVVETDAPYVGRTPDAVKESVGYIAEVKELDFNIVAEQTTKNAKKFFNFR